MHLPNKEMHNMGQLEGRKAFPMYLSWKDAVLQLPDDQIRKLLEMIFDFEENDNLPCKQDNLAWFSFQFIRGQLESDKEKWARKSIQNSKNSKQRSSITNDNERKQTESVATVEGDGEGTVEVDGEVAVDGEADVDGFSNHQSNVPSGQLSISDMDAVYTLINRISDQHWKFKDDEQKRQFYDLVVCNVGDNIDDVKQHIMRAWKKVSDNISLLPKFKPFDIFRENVFFQDGE